MKNLKKAIAKIEEDGIEKIIELASETICSGWDTVVHYDPVDDCYSAVLWGSGTYLNSGSRLIEVFRVNGNFISNNSWEIGDIVSEDEYLELRAAVAKDQQLTDEDDIDYVVDFCNPDQLNLIGIDFCERLEEHFSWSQDNMHPDDRILGRLRRELANNGE